MTMRLCFVKGCVAWATKRLTAYSTSGQPMLSWPVCDRCSDHAAQELIAHEDIARVAVREGV
jgi:hypothetical protein